MKEKVTIIWQRPYQIIDGGDIVREITRTSNTLLLDRFEDASLLMEILDTDMREFSERKVN